MVKDPNNPPKIAKAVFPPGHPASGLNADGTPRKKPSKPGK